MPARRWLSRRGLLSGALVVAGSARAAAPALRILVLSDLSGRDAAASGLGTVFAARMAAEEIGSGRIGRAIEVLSADAGQDVARGVALVRRHFDEEGVAAVAGVPDDAMALAVQGLCRERGKVALFAGPLTRALTDAACSPTGFQFLPDSAALARGVGVALAGLGNPPCFLVVGAGGDELVREVTAALFTAGVALVGRDAALPSAASGARAVVLCGDAGGLLASARRLQGAPHVLACGLTLGDIRAAGLEAAQGALSVQPFYWGNDERSRAWSRRFQARTLRMPEAPQIGVYEAIRHYLGVVGELGNSDGAAVARRMRFTPVESAFSRGVRIAADGRVLRPLMVARIKAPGESRDPWDVLAPMMVVPAEEGGRQASRTLCSPPP